MAEDVPTPGADPRVIVVAIDGSDLSTYALHVARNLARDGRAKVVAVHVRHIDGGALGAAATTASLDVQEFYSAADEIARGAHDSATRVLGGSSVAGWTYEERNGPHIEALVDAIRDHGADLIVVGSHGHHPFYDIVVGSIAQGLVQRAPVSVLVARPPQPDGKGGGDGAA